MPDDLIDIVATMPSRYPSPCRFCERNRITVARLNGDYICRPCLDQVEAL